MSSNIEIKKVCKCCGVVFAAYKTTTQYCSHKCASMYYKAGKRDELIGREKYKVKDRWIYEIIRKEKIPEVSKRGKSYYSKKHIDKAFSKKEATPSITEWYSVEEAMAKFNLTRDMVYHYVTFHKIPKIKEGRYIKISNNAFSMERDVFRARVPAALFPFSTCAVASF